MTTVVVDGDFFFGRKYLEAFQTASCFQLWMIVIKVLVQFDPKYADEA